MKKRISGWMMFVGASAAGVASMASLAWSAEVVTRIHAVQPGLDGAPDQVLATVDGRVYDLSASDARSHEILESARKEGRAVRLRVDAEEVNVLSVEELSAQDARLYSDDFTAENAAAQEDKLLFPLPSDYNATIYNSMSEIERVFQSMETRTQGKSQCYQRANYWTYNMHRSFGTRSMKVFMFFTNAYRSLPPRAGHVPHRWWFHVSPMVYYRDATTGEVTERVLDRGWPRDITHPQTMREWTDYFVDTFKECRVIDSYAAVNADDEEWRRDGNRVRAEARRREHCLLRIVPMYYYQPMDIEAWDLQGRRQTGWSEYSLVNHRCAVDFFCR